MGRRYAQAKLVPARPRTHPCPPPHAALAPTPAHLATPADLCTCIAAEVLSAGAAFLQPLLTCLRADTQVQ